MSQQYKGIYTELPKTKSMNTVITDEMVKSFLDEQFHKRSALTMLDEWEKFKASHYVSEGGERKRDWQILSFKSSMSEEDYTPITPKIAVWAIIQNIITLLVTAFLFYLTRSGWCFLLLLNLYILKKIKRNE